MLPVMVPNMDHAYVAYSNPSFQLIEAGWGKQIMPELTPLFLDTQWLSLFPHISQQSQSLRSFEGLAMPTSS
jgi:hypothetical protein